MAEKDKMTAIRLEAAQYKRLQAIGEDLDRPVSWLIRKAVDEFIERQPKSKK
jgi:predicted transcriptional regulator